MMTNVSNGQPQIQVPVVASTELALTAVNALRAEMAIRHEASQQRMDMMEEKGKAQHDDLVRVPTEVQKATTATREFLEQVIARTAAEISHVKGRQIEGIHGDINTAIATLHGEINSEIAKVRGDLNTQVGMSDEKFKSVQTQFTLLKQASEQLELANKDRIAAALQAQKESAGETQKSSQAAIAKSEASTSDAIRTLTATLDQRFTATSELINEIKSRLDRGEGGRSVTDPAVAETLHRTSAGLRILQDHTSLSEGKQAGKDYTVAIILTGLSIAIPAVTLLMVIISKMH